MTKEDAAQYPLVDIAPPPKAAFELRLIVWRCEQLPASSKMWGSKKKDAELSDYYVKAGVENGGDIIPPEKEFLGRHSYADEKDEIERVKQLEEEEKQMNIFQRLKKKLKKKQRQKPPPLTYTSDVHWRAKSGFASWNYRFKIPLMLPRPRLWSALKLSVWDKFVVGRDRVVGEVTLPLRDFFLAAFHSKRDINYVTEEVLDEWVAPEHPERAPDGLRARSRRDGTGRLAEGTGVLKKGGAYTHPEAGTNYREFANANQVAAADNDSGDVVIEMVDMGSNNRNPFRHGTSAAVEPELSEALDPERDATIGSNLFEAKADDRTVEVAQPAGSAPLRWDMQGQRANTQTENEVSVTSCISKAREMMGYPTEVAEDAIWLPLKHQEMKNGQKVAGPDGRPVLVERGRLLVSLEIVPVGEAQLIPAGEGRNGPQALPGPTGRFQLTPNPFMLLARFIGPTMCRRTLCGLFVILIVAIAALVIWQFNTVSSMYLVATSFVKEIGVEPKWLWLFPTVTCAVLAIATIVLLCCCYRKLCVDKMDLKTEYQMGCCGCTTTSKKDN